MSTQSLRNMVAISAVLLACGCANNPFYHRHFMAGHVTETSEGRAVVCTGESGVVEAGQVLDAYRDKFSTNVVEEGESGWAHEWVGKVRVDRTFDEHFAAVDIVEGSLMKDDIVEFERR